MCEATCVISQLKYPRDDLDELADKGLQALAVEALQNRIDVLIRQLEYFGEGNNWCNPDQLQRSTDNPRKS